MGDFVIRFPVASPAGAAFAMKKLMDGGVLRILEIAEKLLGKKDKKAAALLNFNRYSGFGGDSENGVIYILPR